ncbi:hypothetical protein IKF15_01090 [Candidatus Saccharibacteria bacterium]|nr:hypothetical protein [Candidatus Saccharibacteria bacterium]
MEILSYFLSLYKQKSQVILLAWAYSIITVISVLVAGLVALINQSAGVAVLIIPLIAVVALCVNVVVWAMIRFIIDSATRRIEAERTNAEGHPIKTKETKTTKKNKTQKNKAAFEWNKT